MALAVVIRALRGCHAERGRGRQFRVGARLRISNLTSPITGNVMATLGSAPDVGDDDADESSGNHDDNLESDYDDDR